MNQTKLVKTVPPPTQNTIYLYLSTEPQLCPAHSNKPGHPSKQAKPLQMYHSLSSRCIDASRARSLPSSQEWSSATSFRLKDQVQRLKARRRLLVRCSNSSRRLVTSKVWVKTNLHKPHQSKKATKLPPPYAINHQSWSLHVMKAKLCRGNSR